MLPVQIPLGFRSERLVIRCPRPEDASAHFAAVSESLEALRRFPASLSWAMEPPSLEASVRYCREGAETYQARTDLPMLLFLKDSGLYVGSSGLHDLDWARGSAEIGFWVRTSHVGRGLVTEAVKAITAFAFGQFQLRRVEAFPDEENLPSRRVCERAGFRLEAILQDERTDPAGQPRATCRYAQIS